MSHLPLGTVILLAEHTADYLHKMPSYELALILRQMPRQELTSVLKRTASSILSKGGIIRKLENLGFMQTPYKIREHGLVHREGVYFNIEFDVGPTHLSDLREEFGRDIDIIKRNIYKKDDLEKYKCSLSEELIPPAYREDVREMIQIAKKKQKPKYQYRSGLDYYPFQK